MYFILADLGLVLCGKTTVCLRVEAGSSCCHWWSSPRTKACAPFCLPWLAGDEHSVLCSGFWGLGTSAAAAAPVLAATPHDRHLAKRVLGALILSL